MDGECKAKFMELKTKRNYRFVVFKIDEKEMKISVERVGLPEENYGDFAACLPPDECRYAVYDFDFVTSENCNKSKIFFIAWYVNRLFFLSFLSSLNELIKSNSYILLRSNLRPLNKR